MTIFCAYSDVFAIRIGVILPETGRYSSIAAEMRAVYELGFRDLKLNTDELELVFEDNYSQTDSAYEVANRLAEQEDVIALMGGFPSSCALEVERVAEGRSIPYLIDFASADSLTKRMTDYCFRIGPPSSEYNESIISWATSVVGKERDIAIVHDDTAEYARSMDGLKSNLSDRWSGRIGYFPFKAKQADFTSVIKTLKSFNPAIVWMLGSGSDAARFLRQARARDWQPYIFVAGLTSMVNRRLISDADGAAEYIIAPAVWWNTPIRQETQHFIHIYKNTFKRDPDYREAEAYAAMQVMIDAIRRAKEIDRDLLQSSLEETHLTTVVGLVSFEDYRDHHNQNRLHGVAVQVLGSEWRVVWPFVLSETNYVYPIPSWHERAAIHKSALGRYRQSVLLTIAVIALVLLIVLRRTSPSRRMDK
jgi:branched-chain amino acid transport system substrate-binding protein